MLSYFWSVKKTITLMPEPIETILLSDLDPCFSSLRIVNQSRVKQMEDSLALHGQLQPLIVRRLEDKFQIIDGLKRYYASKNLSMKSLQGRCVDVDLTHAKVLVLRYNRAHRSMEAWEEALVLHDLKLRHGHDLDSLSKLTGYSRSWVSRRLSLIEKMDKGLSHEIKMGTLTGSHARELMRLPRGNQCSMAGVIVSNQLSSRQSHTLVNAFLRAKNKDVQDYILSHPREVLRQHALDELDAYDARLSADGNELLKSLRYLKKSLDIINARLSDSKIQTLSAIELDILFEVINYLRFSCDRFLQLSNKLYKSDN
jgi:ParB family transcriptional regulator, chromosome partitioning protein